jgi:anti-sigma-K factor RskA
VDATMSHGEYEELAAGYVLGALEPDDEHAFQRHLDGCSVCAASVRDLEAVAGELAWAVNPVEPPPALRAAIRRKVGLSTRHRGVLVLRPRVSPAVVNRVAVAAGIVALLALAFWNLSLRNQATVDQERLAAYGQAVRLVNDPTATRILLAGPARDQGARVTVFASSRQDRGAVVAEGLPPIPSDRVYELWALPKDGQAVPLKVMRPAKGVGVVNFQAALQPTTEFGVTNEPGPNGSPQPTNEPILKGSPGGTA